MILGNPRSVLMKQGIFIDINQIGAVWRSLSLATLNGAKRRFKTRIGLLAQPNFTPPISGTKVLADASISASAA